jgi:hypothetical protein
MSESYRGRLLSPKAFGLRDGAGWTSEIVVAETNGSQVAETRFTLKEVFASEKLALAGAMKMGKDLIDWREDPFSAQDKKRGD